MSAQRLPPPPSLRGEHATRDSRKVSQDADDGPPPILPPRPAYEPRDAARRNSVYGFASPSNGDSANRADGSENSSISNLVRHNPPRSDYVKIISHVPRTGMLTISSSVEPSQSTSKARPMSVYVFPDNKSNGALNRPPIPSRSLPPPPPKQKAPVPAEEDSSSSSSSVLSFSKSDAPSDSSAARRPAASAVPAAAPSPAEPRKPVIALEPVVLPSAPAASAAAPSAPQQPEKQREQATSEVPMEPEMSRLVREFTERANVLSEILAAPATSHREEALIEEQRRFLWSSWGTLASAMMFATPEETKQIDVALKAKARAEALFYRRMPPFQFNVKLSDRPEINLEDFRYIFVMPAKTCSLQFTSEGMQVLHQLDSFQVLCARHHYRDLRSLCVCANSLLMLWYNGATPSDRMPYVYSMWISPSGWCYISDMGKCYARVLPEGVIQLCSDEGHSYALGRIHLNSVTAIQAKKPGTSTLRGGTIAFGSNKKIKFRVSTHFQQKAWLHLLQRLTARSPPISPLSFVSVSPPSNLPVVNTNVARPVSPPRPSKRDLDSIADTITRALSPPRRREETNSAAARAASPPPAARAASPPPAARAVSPPAARTADYRVGYRGMVSVANKRLGDILRLNEAQATLEVMDGASIVLDQVPLVAVQFVAQPRALEIEIDTSRFRAPAHFPQRALFVPADQSDIQRIVQRAQQIRNAPSLPKQPSGNHVAAAAPPANPALAAVARPVSVMSSPALYSADKPPARAAPSLPPSAAEQPAPRPIIHATSSPSLAPPSFPSSAPKLAPSPAPAAPPASQPAKQQASQSPVELSPAPVQQRPQASPATALPVAVQKPSAVAAAPQPQAVQPPPSAVRSASNLLSVLLALLEECLTALRAIYDKIERADPSRGPLRRLMGDLESTTYKLRKSSLDLEEGLQLLLKSLQAEAFARIVSDLAGAPSETSNALSRCLSSLASAIESDLKKHVPLRILREDLLECIEGYTAKFPRAAPAQSMPAKAASDPNILLQAAMENLKAEGVSPKAEKKHKRGKKEKKKKASDGWTGEHLVKDKFYVVLKEFEAKERVQVSVSKGEKVQYVATVDQWSWVRKADGTKGYIPGYYLDSQPAP